GRGSERGSGGRGAGRAGASVGPCRRGRRHARRAGDPARAGPLRVLGWSPFWVAGAESSKPREALSSLRGFEDSAPATQTKQRFDGAPFTVRSADGRGRGGRAVGRRRGRAAPGRP